MKDLPGVLDAICNYAKGILEEAETFRTLLKTESAAPEKTYTIEDVRAALVEKTRAGFRRDVKELLEKHGAEKLNDLDPAAYAVVIDEAKEIGA